MSRRTRRPPVRPPSWRHTGWTPAPNALTPAEVAAAMAAPVTPPREPLPDNLRSYQVGVTLKRGRLHAYLCQADARWSDYCEHGVSATSSADARDMAIQEHRERCFSKATS